MNLHAVWEMLKEAVVECRENKAQRLAAALAYYAMCSLAPLLILIVALAAPFYGRAFAEGRLVRQLRGLVGQTGADALHTLMQSVQTPAHDIITLIIGGAGLLFVASGLFNHLRDSLNTIWEVTSPPTHPVRGYFMSRLLSIVMVLSVGIVALLGLMISVGLEDVIASLARTLPDELARTLVRGGQMLLSFVILTALVALSYKVLPDATIAWRDTLLGAATTALLIVLGQALVGYYLRSGVAGSAFSLMGAVVIVLVWVYYAALIFFFGAELTWSYAGRYGSRIRPAPHALSLSAGDRAAQGLLRTSEIEAVADRQRSES